MYAVVVTLLVKQEAMSEFLPLMLENARKSLADEPGCHRFDVCRDEARPTEVFLYELYTDCAAFEAHLESAHFKDFDHRTTPLVLYKEVSTYATVTT